MWDVILTILSVIGILLLLLLGLLFAAVFAMLFCPVVYRFRGEKTPGATRLDARISWLFGLLQIRYSYPEPGSLTAKLLWKTVFDSSKQKESSAESFGILRDRLRHLKKKDRPEEQDQNLPAKKDASGQEDREPAAEEARTEQKAGSDAREGEFETADTGEDPSAGFLGKISRLKYTIQKIYDKIKSIWNQLSRFAELLQEENTRALWDEVKRRLIRVFRSVRPRRIRAELLFGTGSPDTTGLTFGFYGMLSPFLGENVCVTPDFTQKILEGNIDISGHITGFVLFRNGVGLLLDRKLHLFLKRLKSAVSQQG